MAEFKYYLNRQGVRGPQGPQGEKGFSPDISVEKDTLSEYVLRITNEGGYFLTANLREHKEDRGGTYIRYDRATGVMYAGDAEPATTDTLGVIRIAKDEDFTGKAEDTAVTPAQVQDYTTAKIAEVNQRIDSLDATNVKVTGTQAIAGTKTFTDGIVADRVSLSNGNSVLRPDAGRLKIGSTSNTAGTKLEGPYVEVRGTNVDIYGKFTAHGFADFNYNTTFYQDAIIKGSAKDDNNNLYLKQNTITAGDNVQITSTADGIKISSTAQGDVTLAGDNSFTGNNTFDGETTFNAHTWTAEQEAVNLSVTSLATMKNVNVSGTLTSSGEINAVSIKAAGIKNNQNNKYYLNQGSITAGDNVTIEETTDGVKISSTGGGSSEPPANMVTTDTAQTITGAKTLDNSLYVNNPDMISGAKSISTEDLHCSSIELGRVWTSKNSDYIYSDGYRRISAIAKNGVTIPMITCNTAGTNPNIISFGVSDAYDVIIPARAKTYGGKKFLIQGSITAGSDNLVIADTTDGIQITCNAPTNAQIEVLQRLINDLSTKIDNLTTRLNNLEEVIDGGVAGSIYPADPQKIDALSDADSGIENGKAASEDIQIKDGE